jgi:transposase
MPPNRHDAPPGVHSRRRCPPITQSTRRVRADLSAERTRWLIRARSHLRAAGIVVPKGASKIDRMLAESLDKPDGLDLYIVEALELCARMTNTIKNEIAALEAKLLAVAKTIAPVQRLKTIPAVGDWVALYIYAWVGDIRRFRNARMLASYAGLVPSVHQSGETLRLAPDSSHPTHLRKRQHKLPHGHPFTFQWPPRRQSRTRHTFPNRIGG